MPSDPTPAELAQEIEDYLAEGWVYSQSPAFRMLTQAAQLLHRVPPPPKLWAVAVEDDNEFFVDEMRAREDLAFRNETNAGYVRFRLYEVQEVPDAH